MDFLRIFACFMVVFLHVSAQNWHITNVRSVEWQIFNVYDTAVRSCVPLFFMISGKLFLSRESMVPLSRLFKKNIAKLVWLYLLWSFLYAIDTVGLRALLSGTVGENIIRHTIQAKYHLWYIPALIGVYMLIPVLWSLVKYEKGKYLIYACVMFFLFGIIKKTILAFPIDGTIEALIKKVSYALGEYSGYFLLGYVLDLIQEKFSKIKSSVLVTLLFAVIAVSAVITSANSISVGKPTTLLYDNLMIPACVEAMIIFLLFLRIQACELSGKIHNIITTISKYTLFVYLAHVFVMQHLDMHFGLSTMSFYPLISVPVLSIIIFLICMAGAWVIDNIPVLRKILM